MKYIQLVCVSASLVLGGCSSVPNGSSIDHAAAQKVADSFMADLVADRADSALEQDGARICPSDRASTGGGRNEKPVHLLWPTSRQRDQA